MQDVAHLPDEHRQTHPLGEELELVRLDLRQVQHIVDELEQVAAVAVEFAIKDNGIGIDDATLKRLFKPFTQADSSTTRRFGGTGLGLAIAQQLCELMGGTIKVRSIPDLGSTFVVCLPFDIPTDGRCADNPQKEHHQTLVLRSPQILPTSVRRSKVLLVAEDNATNREVLSRQLNLLGFSFEIFVNGQLALEAWRTGRFTAVLTDLHMPELDGYGLVAAIRLEEANDVRTPVAALTANALKEEGTRCLSAGMDEYLTKPCKLPVLRAAIERLLASKLPPAEPLELTAARLEPVLRHVLAELVGDDPATLRELYTDFLGAARRASTSLRSRLLTEEWSEARSITHQLKSSARSVGALRLGDLSAEFEAATQEPDVSKLAILQASLQGEIAVVCQWIEQNIVETTS